MLDCENRLKAAEFFQAKAKEYAPTIGADPFVWYIQASVVFVISALEILYFDYAERKALVEKGENVWPSSLKAKYAKEPFFEWLNGELEDGLFKFLRDERNRIVHEGHIKRKIGPELGIVFGGWTNDSVDEAVRKMVNLANRIISEAKRRYPEQLERDR